MMQEQLCPGLPDEEREDRKTRHSQVSKDDQIFAALPAFCHQPDMEERLII